MLRKKEAVRKSAAKVKSKKKAASARRRSAPAAISKKASRKKSSRHDQRRTAAPAARKRKDPAEQFMKDYLEQLRTERRGGAPTLAEIQRDVHIWGGKCAKIKDEITKAEALAKKRKREIDEWKLWYNGIAKIDKAEEWARLEHEIAWRAHEINDAQKSINKLYEQLHRARTQLQIARQRLLAFEHGVFERPLKDDPRYVAIIRERSKS